MASLKEPSDEDRPTMPSPKQFEKDMQSGHQRLQLLAMRAQLTYRLQVAASRDVAPIAKELREVVAALQALPGEKVNPLVHNRNTVNQRIAALEAQFGRGTDAEDPGTPGDA